MRSSTGENPGGHPRDGSEFYIARARESLRLAEKEQLPARRAVHMHAAERWILFAERAKRMEARPEVPLKPASKSCPA